MEYEIDLIFSVSFVTVVSYSSTSAPWSFELQGHLLEMDPLSLTASILAVLGATHTTGKLIKKLWSLKNAPTEILVLANEVSKYYHQTRTRDEYFLGCLLLVVMN